MAKTLKDRTTEEAPTTPSHRNVAVFLEMAGINAEGNLSGPYAGAKAFIQAIRRHSRHNVTFYSNLNRRFFDPDISSEVHYLDYFGMDTHRLRNFLDQFDAVHVLNGKKTDRSFICLNPVEDPREQAQRIISSLGPVYEGFGNMPVSEIFRLGVKLRERKRYQRSIHAFETVLEKDQQNIEAYVNLGMIHRDINNPATALQFFKQALVYTPNHRFAQEQFARIER